MLNAVIVFSKDRPMQLDCTLRSLKKNAPKPDYLSVIYKASNEFYKKGYEKIDSNLIEESIFKQNVLDSLLGDYTLFLTDDDIVFKEISYVGFNEEVCCFSYRLGTNISYCYSNDRHNRLKNFYYGDKIKYINWDWKNEELDFAYPLSVTSHLFKTEFIKKLTEKIHFNNPNEYEAALQQFVSMSPRMMMSYVDSRIVGVPVNKVNTSFENRNGLVHSYSTEELNNMFLADQRIDFEKMDFNIISAQQELKYIFA